MELDWIWKSILIFFVGTFILRIGGRKSISQMREMIGGNIKSQCSNNEENNIF